MSMLETDDNPAQSEPAGGAGGAPAPSGERAGAGSRGRAGERLVAEHADAVWRFVRSRVTSPDAAEDVVQETFLAAMQSLERFSGASTERTWLLGIASHKIADHFRREARHTHRPGGGALEACRCAGCRALLTAQGMWARTPGEWAVGTMASEKAAARSALRACLEQLPEGQREAMWLRDVLGVPAAEVCKALGVTATNLWTRLHRARFAVRTCLEQKLGGAEGGAGDSSAGRDGGRGCSK